MVWTCLFGERRPSLHQCLPVAPGLYSPPFPLTQSPTEGNLPLQLLEAGITMRYTHTAQQAKMQSGRLPTQAFLGISFV